jgi:predicted RNA polymerase sigma factor
MQEPAGVSQLVEHLFRHESGKMVATLTRIFGLEHLTLAEDVVQEALSRVTDLAIPRCPGKSSRVDHARVAQSRARRDPA